MFLIELLIDKGYISDGDYSRCIDYVLVYEICKEKEEKDDDVKEDVKMLV